MNIPTHKICRNCGVDKSMNEFGGQKSRKDNKQEWCKECHKEYYKKHSDKIKETQKRFHREHGGQSMQDNKDCPQFLGIVVGEKLCRHLFKDVEVMPLNNKGYDIKCNRGKLIDVKTACTRLKRKQWQFNINKNQIADWFILVALDNRTDLNVLHMWMIPGKNIQNKKYISISPSTIHKWDKWKRDIDDAQLCCNTMKGVI